MGLRGAAPARTIASISAACETASDGDELLERVDAALRKAIPYDGASWFGTDPATLLSSSPARIEGIDSGHCDSFWRREFLVEDTNLFRDLQRNDEPVAALRLATDDRPVRSARYREFLAPQGYDDELRAVFTVGGNTWGITGLYREKSRPAFTTEECRLVASVAPIVASALRTHVAGTAPGQLAPAAPGLLMFDGDGCLVTTNAEASRWLSELDHGGLPLDLGYPPSIVSLVARARAVFEGHEPGPARLRLRSGTGQWLVAHASCMGNRSDDMVTVVIEPAKSSDIAPIIVEAYGLSPREREVVRALARGMTSADIATELYLSPHTVRDYVKSVFEKVGVSSRGELVARLFADHYSEPLHASAVHVE
ncbi:MAG TPA: LuxR C-terminal-related transcriptional regulator [Mycobacteriales bacterium]|nr:LuxR C-terminal-related transcriptional regulator [Mycobacteriales bacterium]HVU61153.1 LuxR C-terminal-related transcriptional regulator [Mycobacteriales bacterium]